MFIASAPGNKVNEVQFDSSVCVKMYKSAHAPCGILIWDFTLIWLIKICFFNVPFNCSMFYSFGMQFFL
jgi:hypothetical protein